MRFFCLLVFALLHLPVLAQSAGYRMEQAYYLDAEEKLRPDTLSRADFKPYQGDLRLGYANGTTWVRLTIAPEPSPATVAINPAITPQPEPLIVRVGPYLLDLVELHEQVEGRWVKQVRGDQHPQKAGYCPSDAHCFLLSGATDPARTVFLRLKNEGVMFMQAEVLPWESNNQSLIKRATQRSISLTMALSFLAFGLLYLTIDFSILLIIYCFYQLFVVLFVMASLGLLGDLLNSWSSSSVDTATSILFALRVTMTLVLCWAVVAAYQPSRLYKRMVAILLAVCGLNVLLFLTGHVRLALQLNYAVFALNPVVHIVGLLSLQDMDKKRRNILVFWNCFFLSAVAIGSVNAFAGMAIEQRTDWLQHFGDWRLSGGVIGLVFFWTVVSEQLSRNAAKNRELEGLRLLAEQARATEEKFTERHALIDMLTHELKTPLGTIKFALAALKRKAKTDGEALQRVHSIDASVNRMDDLIEHVARSNRIELLDLTEKPEAVAAEDLAQELMGDYDPSCFDVLVQPGAVFQADRQMLLVIFENLVSNAHKYMVEGHRIRVSITVQPVMNEAEPCAPSAPGSETCFEISNHISPDAVPDESRLFDRYYRHPSVQSKPGMGIGLSLVQSAARKIGARVIYRQQDDQVFFTIKVPL